MKSRSIHLLFVAFSFLTIVVHLRLDNKITSTFYDIASTFDPITLLSDSFDANSTTESASYPKLHPTNSSHGDVDGGSSVSYPKLRSTSFRNDHVGGSSAICLIIRDDNDILAEWVAYHYHVFNLRRLIVAVDPMSKTSPSSVLEPFEKSRGNFDLDLTIWHDEDYTPTWFHSSDIDPSSYIRGKRNARTNKIQCGGIYLSKGFNTTHDIEQDIILTCKYIKRQLMFYNECLSKIQTENKNKNKNSNSNSWTALIDTDEYLVPNPWIADYIHKDSKSNWSQENVASVSAHFQRGELKSIYPETPSAGSLWSLFHRFQEATASATKSNTCVMIPRINFGGEEDDSTGNSEPSSSSSSSTSNTVWDHKNFQSLRWKYHADHRRKNKPKAILNAAGIQKLDKIVWGEISPKPILGVHVPHKSCDGTVRELDNPGLYEQPFALHHYLGSLKQFMNRDDVRRTVDQYKIKTTGTAYAGGDQNHPDHSGGERWWIQGWLDSFVNTHGSEKVYTVLGENYATISGKKKQSLIEKR